MTSAHTVRSESRARSWWRRAHPVKRAASAGPVVRPGFHFGRSLEGWPFAVVSVGLALIGLALGGLRPVEPEVIPPPFVDAEALRLRSERRRGHARLAVRHPLTFEVRAAGEQFRQYGLAVSQGTLGAADQARSRFEKLTAQARHTEGSEPLLALRAVQTELFLQALLRWEATRRVDQDLLELGGDFPAKARSSGWGDKGPYVERGRGAIEWLGRQPLAAHDRRARCSFYRTMDPPGPTHGGARVRANAQRVESVLSVLALPPRTRQVRECRVGDRSTAGGHRCSRETGSGISGSLCPGRAFLPPW